MRSFFCCGVLGSVALVACSADQTSPADGGAADVVGTDATPSDGGSDVVVLPVPACKRGAPFGQPGYVSWSATDAGASGFFKMPVRFDRTQQLAVFNDNGGIYFANRAGLGSFVGRRPLPNPPKGQLRSASLNVAGDKVYVDVDNGADPYSIHVANVDGSGNETVWASRPGQNLFFAYPLPDVPVLYALNGSDPQPDPILRFPIGPGGAAGAPAPPKGFAKYTEFLSGKTRVNSVVVSDDELDMYFGTPGGPDPSVDAQLYESHRASASDDWNQPTPMSYLNSFVGFRPEYVSYLSGDGCQLYFLVVGNDTKLYSAEKPPK